MFQRLLGTSLWLSLFLYSVGIIGVGVNPARADEYRLPANIMVRSQSVELTLTPGKRRYSGQTTLQLWVNGTTSRIAYHAQQLQLHSVEMNYKGNVTALGAESPDEFDIVRHELDRTITGQVSLTIRFSGKVGNADRIQGLFLLGQDGHQPYIFSQFQEMEARRVFPSFDEPDKKTRFQFSLNIPSKLQALHNTSVLASRVEGKRKILTFAPTPTINTDVLALAVGQFQAHPLQATSVPSTVYLADSQPMVAGEHLKNLLDQSIQYMSEYLNVAFPYDRLDFFVAPIGTLAAMENVSLIALNRNQLPDVLASDHELCEFNKLIAHEIAHMWFGNLVTMKWYDDFWLSESFTEFFAGKVVRHYYPDNDACTYTPQSKAFIDDNESAQPIRHLVKRRADSESAGQLYYTKGAALMAMLEQHVGTNALRHVFRRYVKQHREGNVTTADFTSLFSASSQVPEIVNTFTLQHGYPLLSLQEENGQLYLTQQSYHGEERKKWAIPVTLTFWDGNETYQQRMVLSESKQAVPDVKPGLPVFIDTNAVGYFRSSTLTNSDPFPLEELSLVERLAAMDNSGALASTGQLNYHRYIDDTLRIIKALPADSPEVANALTALIDAFIRVVPANLSKSFADYLLEQLPKKLAWEAIIQHENGGLWLELYGHYLKSASAVAFARAYFSTAVPAHLQHRVAVLRVIASHADEEEYQQLLTLFEHAEPDFKEDLLDALGYVKTAEQVNAFYDFLLSEATTGFVIDYRFQFPAFQPSLRSASATYIKQHKLAIEQRIVDDQLQWFPYNFLTACSVAERKIVSATFADWQGVPGLTEKLNVVLAEINRCSADSAHIHRAIEKL